MRTYEEIYQEIAEWDDELSDALDELCSLRIAEETTSMLHAMDDEEIEWLEIEYAEIQERIDSAEFWLCELESELDSIEEAASDDEDDYDELIAMVEVAEENALCELAAFGFVTPGFKRHMWEFDPDEIVCFYEYDLVYDEYGFEDFEEGCWPEERVLFELL